MLEWAEETGESIAFSLSQNKSVIGRRLFRGYVCGGFKGDARVIGAVLIFAVFTGLSPKINL